MRFISKSKLALRGLSAAAVTVGVCAIPVAAASAASASSTSPTKAIAMHADTYVNDIRAYFFCETAKCKKARSAEETAAAKGMRALVGEANAVSTSSVPSSQQVIVRKFVADVRALYRAYVAYPKESAVADIARNTGLIYYQSANVGSDTYLLSVDVSGAKPAYVPWSVGAVAVLYAMQVDTEALNAKTGTVADDINASQNLEQEAASLLSDANGPSAKFNALLVAFATTQDKLSAAEILILQKKKATLSRAQLAAFSKQLGAEFTQIVNLQKALSK